MTHYREEAVLPSQEDSCVAVRFALIRWRHHGVRWAGLGEAFPLACPNCGGDIGLISFITQPGPIRKILTHVGEPLVPPPVSPARGPPVDWDDLVQAEDDRSLHQASPEDVPMIDIHRR